MTAFPKFPTTCKDCEERKVGCHSTCEKFRAAKEAYDAQRDELVKRHKREYDVVNFHRESVEKTVRAAHDRKKGK